MSKTIFLIAGEPSGDVLGARLMKALKGKYIQKVNFIGIGGPLMQAEGLESLIPMEEICVMGLWEVIGHLPRLLRLIDGTVADIEKHSPDALITIDLPDFNFQVASRLKKRDKCNPKIIHYAAPTVWAWRPGRAKKIAQFLDAILCLYPFEPPYFTKHGLRAAFVGHPLVETKADKADGEAFRKHYEIEEKEIPFGLFFGSREGEFSAMSKTLKEAISIVVEHFPELVIVCPTLKQYEYDILKLTEDIEARVIVVPGEEQKWNAFAACKAALAVSGTVGLELAYMNVPHVIAYKMHPVSWFVISQMSLVKHAHLANIMMQKEVVPECLQYQCRPLNIAKKILPLLKKEHVGESQAQLFLDVRSMLGADDKQTPSEKAASIVYEMVGS